MNKLRMTFCMFLRIFLYDFQPDDVNYSTGATPHLLCFLLQFGLLACVFGSCAQSECE